MHLVSASHGLVPSLDLGNAMIRQSSHERRIGIYHPGAGTGVGAGAGGGGDVNVGGNEGGGVLTYPQPPFNFPVLLGGSGDASNPLAQGLGQGLGQGQGQGQGVIYPLGNNTAVGNGGSTEISVAGGSGNGSFMGVGGGVMTLVNGGGNGSGDSSLVGLASFQNAEGQAQGQGQVQDVVGIGNNSLTNPYNTVNLHVLVVDDSSINRKMLVKVLNNLKYTSEEAEDGVQAVHLITRTMRLLQLQQRQQQQSSHSTNPFQMSLSNVGNQSSFMSTLSQAQQGVIAGSSRSMSIQLSASAMNPGGTMLLSRSLFSLSRTPLAPLS